MNTHVFSAAIAAAVAGTFVTGASATPLPFSTGFESGQGYVNNSQLFANANWQGDGQDTNTFLVTSSAIGTVE